MTCENQNLERGTGGEREVKLHSVQCFLGFLTFQGELACFRC